MTSMTLANGHWDYSKQMGTDAYAGFLYLIVNKETGKSYIGRKQYRVMGKKRSKGYGKSSNWRVYKSSAKPLLADIKALGNESFDFYCIAEFVDKRDLHYAEVKAIMHYDAIVSDRWYNNHAPEIYVPPPWTNFRYRRETLTTLIKRSVNDGKARP